MNQVAPAIRKKEESNEPLSTGAKSVTGNGKKSQEGYWLGGTLGGTVEKNGEVAMVSLQMGADWGPKFY